MINGIAFTGRETMLTEPAVKVISKAHEYVAASKIYPTAENATKEAANLAAKSIAKAPAPVCTNQAAASYALSHGTPKEVLPEAVAKSIDFTV